MQCEPRMPVEERKPQPTRNLDVCKTRQVGQDPGSDLESKNAEALPSWEMGVAGGGEVRRRRFAEEVKRAGPGIRVRIRAPPFPLCGTSGAWPYLSESPGLIRTCTSNRGCGLGPSARISRSQSSARPQPSARHLVFGHLANTKWVPSRSPLLFFQTDLYRLVRGNDNR